jgi:hypothetical protein
MTAGTRRHRQRETILTAADAGDATRATALLAEHVLEFPEDAGLLDGVATVAGPCSPSPPTPSA